MIVSNTMFFPEKNASPENENGWTPNKRKKMGFPEIKVGFISENLK